MNLEVELVYDRYLGEDETLDRLHSVLEGRLPAWMSNVRIWRDRRDQRPIQAGLRKAMIEMAAETGPTYAALVQRDGRRPPQERLKGFEEVRGADPSVAIYISIDEMPFAMKSGSMLLANRVTIQLRRKRIEGKPVATFAAELFKATCSATAPVWGSFQDIGEYDAKVMSHENGVEAVGRDFGRHLPGLFPGNFFGPAYVNVVGRDRLLSAPHAEVIDTGPGIALLINTDPGDWQSPERQQLDAAILDHIGREFFFSKTNPPRAYRAPSWPSHPLAD